MYAFIDPTLTYCNNNMAMNDVFTQCKYQDQQDYKISHQQIKHIDHYQQKLMITYQHQLCNHINQFGFCMVQLKNNKIYKMPRTRQVPETSIFELASRTHKFIRYELVHAGLAVVVFATIFLVLQPWDNAYYYMETHPFWFVGPPLVYFVLDLFFAMFLYFSLKNELRPKSCLIWIAFQVANLILLTFLGFYMVWTYYYRGNTYLRLTISLIVLYCYKAYRISQMHKLIIAMTTRCAMPVSTHQQNIGPYSNSKSPYTIPEKMNPAVDTNVRVNNLPEVRVQVPDHSN